MKNDPVISRLIMEERITHEEFKIWMFYTLNYISSEGKNVGINGIMSENATVGEFPDKSFAEIQEIVVRVNELVGTYRIILNF